MSKTDNMAQTKEESVKVSTEVGYFRTILDALDSVRDEGKLIIKEDGVYSKVVDPSNVMMCICRIKGRALNGIELSNTDQVTIGTEFGSIYGLLSGTSKNSELQVNYPVMDNSTENIQLNILDDDLQFQKPALNPETVPKVPENDPLTHSTRVVVSGSDLKKSIKHAEKTIDKEAGSVIFGTEDETFYVESSDHVEGSFRKEFHQSGPADGELGEKNTEIGFGFLDDIKGSLGRSDNVTIHIKQDNPLRLDVNLDDEGNAQVIYIIAPRIET